MFEDIDLSAIQEENARELVKRLLNTIEQLSAEVRDLRVEIQRLRDENNRLKGEQGKPNIKGNKSGGAPVLDHSSEQERHKGRRRHKRSKKTEVHIDREEVLKVDPARLPADAEYKGCEAVVAKICNFVRTMCVFTKRSTIRPPGTRAIWQNCRQATQDNLVRGSRA